LEISDPRPLAAAIRAGIAGRGLAGRLAPKVSVVVDGGGALGLAALAADVRLEAVPAGISGGTTPICDGSAVLTGHASQWRVAVGGNGCQATVVGQGDAAAVVETTLDCLAILAEAVRSVRARDLPPDIFANAGFGLHPASKSAVSSPAMPVGEFDLSDGSVARGFALPFGQIDSNEFAAFAMGLDPRCELRLAPGRGLLVLGLAAEDSKRLVALARTNGLVIDPHDPRLRIAACAGAPACASAHLPTKKIAAALLAERPDPLEGAPMLHISGCAKKCARPAGPSVALVGSRYGCDVEGDGMAVDAATRQALMQLAERFATRRRRSA
jgi:precorrin-3B synthase